MSRLLRTVVVAAAAAVALVSTFRSSARRSKLEDCRWIKKFDRAASGRRRTRAHTGRGGARARVTQSRDYTIRRRVVRLSLARTTRTDGSRATTPGAKRAENVEGRRTCGISIRTGEEREGTGGASILLNRRRKVDRARRRTGERTRRRNAIMIEKLRHYRQ